MKRISRWLLILAATILPVISTFGYRYFTDWRHTVVIRLERMGCYGFCPIYDVTIYENGNVTYRGHKFVDLIGKRTTNIGESRAQQLTAYIQRANYFSLSDRYDDDYASDLSTAVTFVRIGGREKRIYHYHGSGADPIELFDIEQAIDEATDSQHWTGRPPLEISPPGFWAR